MSDLDDAAVLRRFYAAFAALDAAAMQACYADDASFEDPVFTLQGADAIGAMWTLLCAGARAQGADAWRLEASDIASQGGRGQAHWEAWYRFSATGRAVHNVIDARFVLRDGRIQSHRDRFDFWRWSRQALGAPGWALGWTPLLRAKVRAQAAARLAAFRQRAPRT
jgi:ketosteroid isomerase-like protein